MSLTGDHRGAETLIDTLEALRAEGYDELADELEEMFKSQLDRYYKLLSALKTLLTGTILVGGSLVTVFGFVTMVMQGSPLQSLLFLVLGIAILTGTLALLAVKESFKDHLEDDFSNMRASSIMKMGNR